MTIYLYAKQHSVTGLKYFGKTTQNDPVKYLGSGKYWLRHIRKHGKEFVETLELYEFQDQEEATRFALEFSEKNQIVESKDWANLQDENALDGTGPNRPLSEVTRRKLGDATRGKTYEQIYPEHIAKQLRSSRSVSNVLRGPRSESTKTKIAITRKAKILAGTIKPLMPDVELTKNNRNRLDHQCTICGVTTNAGNISRWHNEKCKTLR